MAYARFGKDSDVYVYENLFHGFTCCSCQLNKKFGVGMMEPMIGRTTDRHRNPAKLFHPKIDDLFDFFVLRSKTNFSRRNDKVRDFRVKRWNRPKDKMRYVMGSRGDRHYGDDHDALIEHLKEHKRAGHMVPEDTTKNILLSVIGTLADDVLKSRGL